MSVLGLDRRGWWRVLKRAWHRLDEENVSILSAGVAFYGVFAVFPGLAGVVSTYALFADPSVVREHFQALSSLLPQGVTDVIDTQLDSLVGGGKSGLGLGVAGSLMLTVWSARRGSDAVVRAITIAYREQEDRNFFKRTALVYFITLTLVVAVAAALLGLVAVPVAVSLLPVPLLQPALIASIGWVTFVALVMVLVAWLFRTAPPRRSARWQWVSGGSVVTTLLWLAGSVALSWYSSNFDSFNETYGALGAVAILLLWFHLAAFALILGATLNSEIEFELVRDTTVGPDRPAGQRDAYVADHRP